MIFLCGRIKLLFRQAEKQMKNENTNSWRHYPPDEKAKILCQYLPANPRTSASSIKSIPCRSIRGTKSSLKRNGSPDYFAFRWL
jgi:hypothetical protein